MSIMKRRVKLVSIATIIIFTISVLCSLNSVVIANAVEDDQTEESIIVNIPDENLKNLIKNGLKIAGDEVTIRDMEKIMSINARGVDIKSLEGIQYCKNLEFLYVTQGSLSDLSPISDLRKLQFLQIHNCKVRNLDALKKLDNLNNLQLKNLPLSNYDSLENLTNATFMHIDNCNIKDISFISNLTNIEYLYLKNNYIEEIPNMNNLKKIQTLDLENNEIKDIKPLLNMLKHTKLEYGTDKGSISLLENLVGNEEDNESENIKKQIESNGYEVNYNKYEAKNYMHLMRVNGKRYIPGESYNLSSDNQLKLEFTNNIERVEGKKLINLFDKNYDEVSDYTASYDKNILTVKVGTDTEYHLSIYGDNIQGLNRASLVVTGYDKSKEEETIKIPGDVNNDGVVNMNDLSMVAKDYNKMKSNSADWNEDEDCITDGIIDIYDISLICSKL